MLVYEPGLGGVEYNSTLDELIALVTAINETRPEILQDFAAACQKLSLNYAGGLVFALSIAKSSSPTPSTNKSTSKLSHVEIFEMCRDALASDWTDKLFRELALTYHDLLALIMSATARLAVGEDPREPW